MGPAVLSCPVSQISNQGKEEIGGNDIRTLTGNFRRNLQAIRKALAVNLSKVEESLGILLAPFSRSCFEG